MSEPRATPLVDKAEIQFHDGDIILYVKTDFARQLERMCAELAAALIVSSVTMKEYKVSKMWVDNAEQALARYGEMKGAGK